MILTKNIVFKKYKIGKSKKKIKSLLLNLLNENNQILFSLSRYYKNSYNKKKVNKLRKYSTIVLIGMGGSILGAKAIYNFLKNKIKKNFFFIDGFDYYKIKDIFKKKKLNLIISKSINIIFHTIYIFNIP